MDEKLLTYCKENSILLDEPLLNLFSTLEDLNLAKSFILKLKNSLGKKFLTKKLLNENKIVVKDLILKLFANKEDFVKLNKFFNLDEIVMENKSLDFENNSVKILSSFMKNGKSLQVEDFVTHFRNRYSELSLILQNDSELDNVVSISKLPNERQKISLIGMVRDKQMTKNNNIILEVEDLTGVTKVLISSSKEDLIKEAENISLDSVLGFKGVGNKDITFVNEIIFPEPVLPEKKNSPVEELALFIGDLHYGSLKFMKKSFEYFIQYLNGEIPNTPEVSKIKYLFIIGDLITGIGNYPNQENDLFVSDLEQQYMNIADLLNKITKDIKIIIIPGNHDGVRLMEPQPIFNERYAWPIYELSNLIVAENPSVINIGKIDNFSGFNVLCYHGFSFPYYANNVSMLVKETAMNSPEKIMKYLLKNRHLAPAHGSTQYFPSEKDPLLIRQAPDIFVAGHTHKSGISCENNVLMISVSTWEGMTSYQEKFGNKPDHCKVPMFNLKTRAIKILDFELEEGIKTYKEEVK